MDVNAITLAIAGRFAAAQVTPPATYTNIRSSSAYPENVLPPLPCVVVFPEEGAFQTGNGTRKGVHSMTVRFYYAEARDLRRDGRALQLWATVLFDQLKGAVQLAGIVARATIDGYRIGLLPYGRSEYSGIEMTVGIVTSESWAATA